MTLSPIGTNFMREWDYRCAERIRMLCGAEVPTAKQKKIAQDEASEAIRWFRDEIMRLQRPGAT